MMKTGKIISVMLILALCLGTLSGCGHDETEVSDSVSDRTENLNLTEYHPEEDIASALKSLTETKKECHLVKAPHATQRKVSLVFLGLAYDSEMEQICKMLQEHNMDAIFIVDGMSAAEERDSVKMLAREGFEIGNYTLKAERQMHEKNEEEIATSFAHTQSILKTILGKTPKYCAVNGTEMNYHIRHAAYCADLETIVKPSSYLSNTSFPTFSSAMGYIKNIEQGEIIAVKLNDTLDELEYESFESDERPATDFDDDLKESKEEEERNTDIVVTVEYLLEALDETETAVVPLERLNIDIDEQVIKMFEEKESTEKYELPEHSAVEEQWFKDSLFIGDSLTLAMSMYSVGMPDTTAFCAYKSITPKQFSDNVTVKNDNGSPTAVFDDICKKNPKQIFILLGTNALASGSNANLIDTYELLIQKLKKQFPDISIYIQGLPPVTKSTAASMVTLTNGRIRKVNIQLAKMADRTGCYYIDLNRALANDEGDLPESIAQKDGIHLTQEGCGKWFEYLKTHVKVKGKK